MPAAKLNSEFRVVFEQDGIKHLAAPGELDGQVWICNKSWICKIAL